MNKPKKSDTNRARDFQLNFLGGIGMYHKNAHIRRNKNKFNFSSPQLKFRILIFKLIESANYPFNGSNFKLNPYMECQSIVQQKGEIVYGGLQL
jgi:hypothetical protein